MKSITQKVLILASISIMVFFNSACSSKPKSAENAPNQKATTQSSAASASVANTETKPTATAPTKKSTSQAMTSSASALTCTSGSDSRTLEVKDLETGCEVIYTKQSEPKSIAQAKNDKSFCSQTVDKVKANLENAGFKCQ